MTSHDQHTISHDAWVTDVLRRLPSDLDLDALARHHQALQRLRAFPDAASLLRGLVAYATTLGSLRILGAWGVLTDVADLAPSSWLERLRAAGPWLQALVAATLALPRPAYLTQRARGRVLLIDATCIRLHGGTGDDQRLHLAYDLAASQFAQAVLTDGHGAETVTQFALQPHDLLVLDSGYGYRAQLAHLQAQHVDGVVRIYPPTFPLETAGGQRLDLRAWLDQRGADQRSILASYRYDDTRYPVRVLALRRAPETAERAKQRAKQRARKRQRAVSEVVTYYADWIVLVTTLIDATTWPDWTIWQLYGARWQIELVFKQAKGLLGLGQLRCRTLASAVPTVWALLLVWVLHEHGVGPLRRQLLRLSAPHPATYPGQAPSAEAVVSGWTLHALVLDTLVAAIRGQWTLAQVEACLPRLRRFLVAHPRAARPHQATEVVAWLTGQRLTRTRPHTDARY